MKTPNDIEQMLNHTTPALSEDEKRNMWRRIETSITPTAVPSPFAFTIALFKPMPVAALALVLVLGLGGTTAAAQQARPGDFLFPVDQALEEVRLALALNDTERASLHIKFAEERLEELRSLLAEDTHTKNNDASVATTSVTSFAAEADVFTDITIVTLEINDTKYSFRTAAQTRAAVVAEIVSRYNIPEATVDAVLDFEIEDRASRISDVADTNRSDDTRVDTTVTLLSSLVDEIDDEKQARFVHELLDTLGERKNIRVEIRDDADDKRIEIRDGEDRIRIQEKDGETRIEIKSDSHDDDADTRDGDRLNTSSVSDFDDDIHHDEEEETRRDNTENEDEHEDDESDSRDEVTENTIEKIEVRVEDGVAEVRMKYNGEQLEFETAYTTDAVLIATIAARSGLPKTAIEENIDIEIRD